MNSDNSPKLNDWPFIEAKKIIVRAKAMSKSEVLLSSGYGPSGFPHIGTFGENKRLEMIIKALKYLDDSLKVKLIVISDDMDGFRKIPDNIDNREMLIEHLHKPLTDVPDPYGKYESYAHYMNASLISFLNRFMECDFEFISSTDNYKKGVYDEKLILALHKYDKIMKIMLPSLGTERQQTYSPFLPKCQKTGKILQVKLERVNIDTNSISFIDEFGEEQTVSVTGGNCKLQWKPDWGMRWAALGVDYEAHGADLQPSTVLSSKICNVLGGKVPELFRYELFLDAEGKKISKSKGNGLSIEQWIRYSSSDTLALFMYQHPNKVKKLSFHVIPKVTDDYLQFLSSYSDGDISNPVWFIHYNTIPKYSCHDITFNLLLNLAKACNPESDVVLWKYIEKYGFNTENKELLSNMVVSVMNYYEDFIKNNKTYLKPDDSHRNALIELRNRILLLDDSCDAKSINDVVVSEDMVFSSNNLQQIVYDVGKNFGYDKKNMKEWFFILYKVLLGTEEGPRIGSFFMFYGKKEVLLLIESSLNR